MTLNVLIIQKVTGNYTATYTGNQRTTTQPEPRKQANTRTPRKIRTSVPRKGIPATPQAVRATLAEIAAENPRVILATLPKPEAIAAAGVTLADYVRDHPEAGIPVKGDKISFIVIESKIHNGIEIPIPEANLPAYILVNQRGELMQMVRGALGQKEITGAAENLGWLYYDKKVVSVDTAIKSAKRLTTWRNLSLNSKLEPTIRITETKRGENVYKFLAQYFTDQLKGVTIKKNTYINIAGIEISARVIIDTLKNLKNEFITLTINAINKTIEIIYTCDGLKGKTTIKHITDTIPGAQIIPVIA
jgi:hypothetical protein